MTSSEIDQLNGCRIFGHNEGMNKKIINHLKNIEMKEIIKVKE